MRRIHLKSDGEIEALGEAGRVSAKALRIIGEHVAPGITTKELDEVAEQVIREEGDLPGFKGYGGFPSTICASVNDCVVHGFPDNSTVLHEGDIVSVDTGAVIDGWFGDNAWTFAVGDVDAETRRLLTVGETSLYAGMRQAHQGKRLGDIGHAVQQCVESAGFGIVRDYCGHGIGRDMHEPPDVLNFGTEKRGRRLRPGLVIAIEPMVVAGSWQVSLLDNGWSVVTADGKNAVHFEKTVAIMHDGSMRVVSTENLAAEPAMHAPGDMPLGVVQPM